jgi:hypothetical protein
LFVTAPSAEELAYKAEHDESLRLASNIEKEIPPDWRSGNKPHPKVDLVNIFSNFKD